MDKRCTFTLIFSSAICAFVLSHPAMTPRSGEVMPPLPIVTGNAALVTAPADDEAMMIALRLEATDALARIRSIEQPH
jgi:hypothetical protein